MTESEPARCTKTTLIGAARVGWFLTTAVFLVQFTTRPDLLGWSRWIFAAIWLIGLATIVFCDE